MAGGADCFILRFVSMKKISNIAAYKFTALPDIRGLRSRLLALCRSWGLKGSILLSAEGINLFVAGDVDQAQNHMRGVLHHGAKPREILEVILQSTIYAGMPRFIRFIAALERVLEAEGRLDELRAPAGG
jgi:hypothetical protein